MVYSLTWLPAVLERAGLKVATVEGWESYGRAEMGKVVGVLCHHTAGPKAGNMPSLQTLIDGRSDLAGPLAQLGLGRDGTYYVIAAGRCNHAGKGSWKGITTGNSSFIGIEAENTGGPDDSPWPAVQMDAYQRGVAAILQYLRQPVEYCAGHKEYAPQRKTDPDFDMDAFRQRVQAFMDGTAPPPQLIPLAEPPRGSAQGRATLRRGDESNDPALVRQLQQLLKTTVDGVFGPNTEAKVREFQRNANLVPDGIVGPKTWRALDGQA